MQKDVIYIDVEDDITAIIGKVKDSKEKVVALVPPKRIGVLQSAVNLRLLKRAAEQSRKHLVLISNNQALLGLASSATIPVAKNLQSKPEVPEVTALSVDDDDDIIDGEQLPVGEHAAIATAKPAVPENAVADLDIDDDTPKRAIPPKAGEKPVKPRAKSGVTVPSFNKFRKKIVIFGGLGILLIAFLVWAIWFAPRATIIIDAQTSNKDVNSTATLGSDLTTNAEEGTIKAIAQQDKQTQSIDFDATGTKDVGEKATGTVTFATNSISNLGTTIPAGTQLTSSGGQVYTTVQTVTLNLSNYNGATTGITASASGEQFNGASGAMSGAPSGISAQLSGSTSGGTSKTVKIVLQADVVKAKQQLASKNADEVKKTLAEKFGSDVKVIDSSFTVNAGEAGSSPAIGDEASTGKAKLTQETTYTMTGIARSDLDTFLKSALENTLTSNDEQRVYETGLGDVKFSDFKQGERTSTVALETVGQIGPKINDEAIKNDAKGKRYGEIQADLKAVDGINDADVKFWPFWVSTVPGDSNKIKIEFKLKNGAQN
jgi:hypothetical protein